MDSLTRAPSQPFTTVQDDLITTLLGVWLGAGLFVDGWAHITRGGFESFFTPWHGLFYSGFVALALWIIRLVRRPLRGFTNPGVPVGYRLGVSGLVVFAIGGVADLIWHSIFGIEVDIAALLSPTHMILLVGLLLILTSPLRSAWHRPTPRVTGWRLLAPALIATALLAAIFQFAFLYASGWNQGPFTEVWNGGDGAPVAHGVLSIMITTTAVVGFGLVLLRRWDPPLGTFTLILGLMGIGMQGLRGFHEPVQLLAPILAGGLLDLLPRRLRPAPSRPTMLRAWAFLGPVGIWGLMFGLLAVNDRLGWPPVLWSGVPILSGLWGLGLAILITLPAAPAHAD